LDFEIVPYLKGFERESNLSLFGSLKGKAKKAFIDRFLIWKALKANNSESWFFFTASIKKINMTISG
jgi:hypothetical protein